MTVVALVVGGVGDFLAPDVTRLELTRRCLVNERGFLVFDPPLDSPAVDADDGALRVEVETNRVTVALAGSLAEAERLEQAFARARPSRYVERRGRNVYRWDVPPSPTQRQAAFDCAY